MDDRTHICPNCGERLGATAQLNKQSSDSEDMLLRLLDRLRSAVVANAADPARLAQKLEDLP